jgi:hypothetical protein
VRTAAEIRKGNAVASKKWRKKNPKYLRQWQIATGHPRKYRARHREKCLHMWARARAKKNGIRFTIIESDIIIPQRCPVLGIRLRSRTGRTGACNTSPTLDRIDTRKGYVRGNICVISWRANCIKRDATLEELEKITTWLRRIAFTREN